MKRLVLKGSIASLVEMFAILSTTLFLTPFIIEHLGQEDYGLWLLILSMIGWFTLLNLGLPSALSRFIIMALEQKDHEKINGIFSTGLVLFCLLGTVAALCMFAISFFPNFFELSPTNENIFKFTLKFIALKVFLDFIVSTFNSIFSAFIRIDIDANIATFNVLLKTIFIVIFTPRFGIWGLLFATIVADLSTQAIKIIFAKKIFKELRFERGGVTLKTAQLLFDFGKYVFVMSSAKIVNKNSSPLIITKVLDLNALAVYGIANRLIEQADAVLNAMFSTFAPMFTKLIARKENIEKTFQTVSQLNLFVGSILSLVLVVNCEIFISLWLGEEFRQGAEVIKILAFTFLISSATRSCRQVLIAQARHKFLSFGEFIGATLSILLALLLSSEYELLGVASAFLIGYFISNCLLTFMIFNMTSPFKIGGVIVRFLLSCLMVIMISIIDPWHIFPSQQSWLLLSGQVLATMVITTVVAFYTMLSSESRTYLINMTKKWVTGLASFR